MRHLPAIDGLRAVAVLSVVAYHADLPVPAGFVGVDIFFVISGYLITRLLHDEVQATGRIDFMGFYARRARRILPALAVIVLATLGLSVLLLPDAGEVARSAAAAGAFVANVFFQAQTGDYWAASSDTMPLLHLWSLSVEEQFYLVWPVVLILARRKPVAALATLAVVSLALAEWWLWREPVAAFYQMPARAWELALGGLVALRPIDVPKGSAWIGLAVVLLACFVPFAHFPGIGALPAVAGSALLIVAIQNGEAPRLLTLRPVVFVGLVSYSFYLWHWPLLAMDRALRVGDAPLTVRLAICGAAFVLAWASYRYVEQPLRRTRASNRRVVGVGLGAVLALSCGAWAMIPPPAVSSRYDARMDKPDIQRCHFGPLSEVTIPKPSCGPGEVAIWGDSYAYAWQPFARALAEHQGQRFTGFGRDYCPPVYGVTLKRRSAVETRLCRQFNDAVVAYVQTHHLDTVILVGRWGETFANDPNAERGLRDAVRAISPYVRRVLVIGPVPELRDVVAHCIETGQPCDIPRSEFTRQSAGVDLRGLPVVGVADWLCTRDSCPGVKNGMTLYTDNRHVTSTAARAFAADYLK